MESSNKWKRTSERDAGRDMGKELDTLERLIGVILVLVIYLAIFQVFSFIYSNKKKKQNLQILTEVVIGKTEASKKQKPASNGSQKTEGRAALPSKSAMIELDVNENKNKEKKVEDLPPVVAVSLEAPPAYKAAAEALLSSSNISEKVPSSSSVAVSISDPLICSAPVAVTPPQRESAPASANEVSSKEVSNAKTLVAVTQKSDSALTATAGASTPNVTSGLKTMVAGTQNSATAVTARDVQTATAGASTPNVTASLKTANPQASTPKVQTPGTPKTPPPANSDNGTKRPGLFGIFK